MKESRKERKRGKIKETIEADVSEKGNKKAEKYVNQHMKLKFQQASIL